LGYGVILLFLEFVLLIIKTYDFMRLALFCLQLFFSIIFGFLMVLFSTIMLRKENSKLVLARRLMQIK
jgi:hypothetical protein